MRALVTVVLTFPAPVPAKPVRLSAGGPGQGPEARMPAPQEAGIRSVTTPLTKGR